MGDGPKTVRCGRPLEPFCESLYRRWRGVSIAAQQVDHDVACCSRHSSRRKGAAVGMESTSNPVTGGSTLPRLSFPLWHVDQDAYRAVCAHLGITPKEHLHDRLSEYLASAPFRFPRPKGFSRFLAKGPLTRSRIAHLDVLTKWFFPEHPLRHVLNGVIALHECDPEGYAEMAVDTDGLVAIGCTRWAGGSDSRCASRSRSRGFAGSFCCTPSECRFDANGGPRGEARPHHRRAPRPGDGPNAPLPGTGRRGRGNRAEPGVPDASSGAAYPRAHLSCS